MKHEVEMALRLLFRYDTSIPPDGRVDLAIEILKGHNTKQPPIVKVRQAADILHVDRSTIDNLLRKGKLVKIVGKNDRLIGISRESLATYLRGEVAASTDQRKLAELRRAMDESLQKDIARAHPRKR